MHLVLSNRAADVEATIRELEQAASAPSLNRVRIGVAGGYFLERLQAGLRYAFESALRQMRDLGADLIDVDWADAGAASAAAMLISRVESANVHRQAIRECPEMYRDDVRDRFEVGALLSGDTYLQARRARVAVRDSIAATFRQHRLDAIVAPTTPATAPPADTLEARYPDGTIEGVGPALTRLTMPWNATGQPVISVPCGFDEESMPVGLSFAGRPDDELELCHIAQAYERAAGWFARRPAM
jgi:aspartyl-tRNA(Asn)/glutamyl-tRNA(Gln) amidotransferase subunit A